MKYCVIDAQLELKKHFVSFFGLFDGFSQSFIKHIFKKVTFATN